MAAKKMSRKVSRKRSSKKRMSCPKGSVAVKGYTRSSGKRVSRHCSKIGKRRSGSRRRSGGKRKH